MRIIVLLLLVATAAAQNATEDPAEGNGTQPPGDAGQEAADPWWAQRANQAAISGLAIVVFLAAFIAVARK